MNELILKGGPPVHPHIFSKRIHRVPRGVSDGDLVALVTRHGRPCGYGFYHSQSLVAVRVLSYQPDVVPDSEWLRERIQAAAYLRSDVLDLSAVTNAWRVIFSEGDDLSGLVVDRYDDVGVVSLFSLGWFRRWKEVRRILAEETGLNRFVLRVDKRTAINEGFDVPPEETGKLVEIEEHGLRFRVDPAAGHKSGFFLDQRDNRQVVAQLARGRTVFDGMAYHGGFALAAAKGGAASVQGMDLDEDAVGSARRNAKLNGLTVDFKHGDVFDALRAFAAGPEEKRPEVLLVDPPKWAKDRAGLGAALYRYGDLNRLALEAVRPDGIVVTSSCSGLVSEDEFLKVLRGAALDTRRAVRFLRIAGAGPDHPIAANFPEGRYLKCVFLTAGDEGSGPGKDPDDISRPPPGGHQRDHGGDRGRGQGGGRGRDDRGGGGRGRDDRGGGGYGGGGGRGRDDRGGGGYGGGGGRGRDDRGGGGYGGGGGRGRDDRGGGGYGGGGGGRGRDDRGGGGYGGGGGRGRDDRGGGGYGGGGGRGRDDRGGGGYGGGGGRGRDDRGRDDRGGGGGGRGRDDRGRDDRGGGGGGRGPERRGPDRPSEGGYGGPRDPRK